MVSVPPSSAQERDARQAEILTMDRHDRAFVLGYLAESVPDTFDAAVLGLAASRSREAFLVAQSSVSGSPPDPV